MTASRAIKGTSGRPQIVAVIASVADLQKAAKLRRLPDFFELRLDALERDLDLLERTLAKLSAPFIITARHPAEGGHHCLSASRRRDLLLRYLPRAAAVDIELRSAAELRSVLEGAQKLKITRIISMHDFDRPLSVDRLAQFARRAHALAADILKIVARTETNDEFDQLAQFFEHTNIQIPMSIMGAGRFGRASRIHFAKHGSALNYAHLGKAQLEGQLSLAQMRRLLPPPRRHPPTIATRI